MWIDAHTHLEMLEGETKATLVAAENAGVTNMITIGCHPKDFEKVCLISKTYFPQVSATLGVHPHDAKFYNPEIENQMRNLSKEPFIVGVGEIGLDYYYNHSAQNIQREAFHLQMLLAEELNLPVQIHSREAEDDTISEIQSFNGRAKGMMHCFSGSARLATAALDAGFYISLSGVITFKNAEALREVVKTVPLDRILVETDAPFLAPIPMRGKKNEPSFVTHTALKVAEIKGVSPAELSHQIKENVKTLFPKWNL
jgi:TatD DNase family protein